MTNEEIDLIAYNMVHNGLNNEALAAEIARELRAVRDSVMHECDEIYGKTESQNLSLPISKEELLIKSRVAVNTMPNIADMGALYFKGWRDAEEFIPSNTWIPSEEEAELVSLQARSEDFQQGFMDCYNWISLIVRSNTKPAEKLVRSPLKS